MNVPPLPDWHTKPTLSVQETAGLLGVHASTVRDAIAAGQMPCLRVGRRQLIPTARLVEMIGPAALANAATQPPVKRGA